MEPKQLVAVVWKDAHGGSSEIFNENEIPHEPTMVTTYGLLLRQDDTGVSIANEVIESGQYRGHTFVPSPLVVEIRIISQSNRAPRKKRAQKNVVQTSAPDGNSSIEDRI